MHELSIAQRIVEIAVEAAARNSGARISSLRVRVGALTCVDVDTLRFAIDVVTRDTQASGCRLDFVRVACRLACRACGAEAERDLLDPCSACGVAGGDIRAGRELQLESIEIDDGDTHSDPSGNAAPSPSFPRA